MAIPTPDVYGNAVKAGGAPVTWFRFDSAAMLTDTAATPVNGVAPLAAPSATNALTGDRTANQGANFLGTNQYFTQAANAKNNLNNNLSIEFWISMDSYVTGGYPSGTHYFLEKADAAFTQGWGFSLWDGNLTFHTATPDVGFTNCWGPWMQPGRVFHVVGVINQNVLRLYVNGRPYNSMTVGGTFGTLNGPLFIGRRASAAEGGPYLDGRLDEIALYNRVLTDEEVWEHYVAGKDNLARKLVNDQLGHAMLKNDPLGWIRVHNNTVMDIMGDATHPQPGLTGAVVGANIQPGAINVQSIDFDGVNDFLTIPANSKWEPANGFIIEAWIRPDSITGTRTIIVRDSDYNIALVNGIPQGIVVTANGTFTINGTVPLTVGKTYHIAMVYRENGFWGSGIYLYVDGAEVAAGVVVTGTRTVDSRPTYVGSNAGSTNFFDGKISDVAVYGIPYSARRIREHTQKGHGFYNPGRFPFVENYDWEMVDQPWPPEWETFRVHQRNNSSFGITWDGKGAMSVGGAYGTAMALLKNGIPAESDMDITFTASRLPTDASDFYVMATLRHDGKYHFANPWVANNGYVLRITRWGATTNTVDVDIRKCVNGVESIIFNSVTIPSALWTDNPMKIRFQIRGGILRFKIWSGAAAEPITWMGSVTDASPLGPGYVGMGCINGADGTGHGMDFDNIVAYVGRGLQHFAVVSGAEVPLDMNLVNANLESPLRTAAPIVTLVYDDFNRANTATLGTAPSGQAWVDVTGTTQVLSNRADPVSLSTIAVIDVGRGDFDVSVDAIYELANPVIFGLTFHVIDGGNSFSWYSDGTTLKLVKHEGSVLTELRTFTGYDFQPGQVHRLRVKSNNQLITTYINDQEITVYTMSPTEYATFKNNGRVGLRQGSSGAGVFDNFLVESTAIGFA